MKKEFFLTVLTTIILAICASAGWSAPGFFYDRSSFLADGRVATTTNINFDDLVLGTDLAGREISGVTFSAPGITPLQIIQGSTGVRYTMATSTGSNVLSPGGSDGDLENDDLALTFATPAKAVGMDVVFDVPDGWSFVRVTFYDSSNNVIYAIPDHISAPVGLPGYQFVGLVTDSALIKKVVFDEWDDSAMDDNVAYDSLVFSPSATQPPTNGVPEPATMLLLGLGLVGLAGVRRKLHK